MASQRAGTELANHLVQKWASMFRLAANEERVVTRHFDQDVEVIGGGVTIGNLLNVRKIGPVTVQTFSPTAGDPSALTFHTATEAVVTVPPDFRYAAVEIGDQALSRTGDYPGGAKYARAYRQQIAAGIAAAEDSAGAQLAPLLTTSVRGGPAENFTKALLFDAAGALIIASKNHQNINRRGARPLKYLCYHPTQYKHVMSINEITAANIRGGQEMPMVRGAVWEALDMEFAESGNIYQDTVTHNLLYLGTAYMLAYNIPFHFEDPQRYQIAWRFIGSEEFGVGEIWDEDAVDIQTSLTG